jgi:hypothetical protein
LLYMENKKIINLKTMNKKEKFKVYQLRRHGEKYLKMEKKCKKKGESRELRFAERNGENILKKNWESEHGERKQRKKRK